MMKRFKAPLIYGLIYAIMGLGMSAYADDAMVKNPINATSFGALVEGFANLLVKIGIPIATIFIVWAGFLFVSARGNDEQIKKAKATFYWTIIGSALVVGAWALASAIVNFAQQL